MYLTPYIIIAQAMIPPKAHAAWLALKTSPLPWEAEGLGITLVDDCPVDVVDARVGFEEPDGVVLVAALGRSSVTTVVIVTTFPASSVLVVSTTSEGSRVLDG
jgi:hypothetical protein